MSEQTLAIVILVYFLTATAMAILFIVWFFKHREYKKRFSGVENAQDEERRLIERTEVEFKKAQEELSLEKRKIEKVRSDYHAKYLKLKDLEDALIPLEDLQDDQDLGFFEPKFQLEDHAAYVFAIKKNREEQKELVRRKKAVVCENDWTVGGSRAEGRKMANRAIRIALRSFNNECDVLITKINWKNLGRISDRIERSREAINKLNETLEVVITQPYLRLKLMEAELVNEERLKKEEERERLRAQRAEEREEAKAQREIQMEMKRQEKREREKTMALKRIRAEMATASSEHRDALIREAALIEDELAEAALEKGRLVSMAEATRIGHLYVISNKGAFSERLVKIGMTRRLEPLDRVKELGDASVPFPFDVHAMVFSEDAPGLEKELHNAFDKYRSNKVNLRKEFFEVPLESVRAELERRIPGVPFDLDAPSMEYSASRSASLASPISQNDATIVSDRFESSP